MDSFWTKERTALLKSLWSEGFSASQICQRLRARSRSAVIGKLYRLGLSRGLGFKHNPSRRNKPGLPAHLRPRRAKSPKPVSKIKAALLRDGGPLPPAQATDIARKSLFDLGDNECKFPVGDPGEPGFGFCASERVAGTPYCLPHLQRCYSIPPSSKPVSSPALAASAKVMEAV